MFEQIKIRTLTASELYSHPPTNELMQSLIQCKHYLGLQKSGHMQDEEKQFANKLLQALFDKINIDMISLSDFLLLKDLEEVDALIKFLIDIVKDLKMGVSSDYSRCKSAKNPPPKAISYKPTIKTIKHSIGLTDSPHLTQQSEKGKLSISEELSDDGFLQRFSLHISNIQYYQSELMMTLEKQILGKAFLFLSEHDQILNGVQADIDQDWDRFRQMQTEIKEIQNSCVNVNSLIDVIKIPVCRTVRKILKQIQHKKQTTNKKYQKDTSTQTTLSSEAQYCKQLSQKVENQNKQILKIRSSKAQVDKQLYKCKQDEFELKLQFGLLQKQKQNVDEILKKQQINFGKLECKLKNQIGKKIGEIQKLEKAVQDLKYRICDLENANARLRQESMRTQRKGTIHRLLQRQSNNISLNTRQSVDLKQDELERSNFDWKASRKIVTRRTGLDLSSYKGFNQVKAIQKASNIFEAMAQEQKMRKRQLQEKLQRLQIHQQFSIIIDSRRPIVEDDFDSVEVARAILAKKSKTLRMLKPSRKQNTRTSDQPQASTNFNTTGVTISSFLKQHRQANKKNRLSYQANTEYQQAQIKKIMRLQSEMRQIKQYNSNSRSLQVQKEKEKQKQKEKENLKSQFAIVRKLKGRVKNYRFDKFQFKSEKSIVLLPDLGVDNLGLFGGQKCALQFQRNAGIWCQLYNGEKLVLDYENTNYCNSIQKYFSMLQQTYPDKFQEYITFLSRPYTFSQNKRKNQTTTTVQPNQVQIKQIFTKLIRFHKLNHKGCSHVSQFLQTIGFFDI